MDDDMPEDDPTEDKNGQQETEMQVIPIIEMIESSCEEERKQDEKQLLSSYFYLTSTVILRKQMGVLILFHCWQVWSCFSFEAQATSSKSIWFNCTLNWTPVQITDVV